MLPLSDHFTRQGQTITMCTLICLFQGNLLPENEQITPFRMQQVGKRSKSCYHYQITSPVKDRLSLRALKYVYSKVTYRLSMSESHHFTVQQVGKRSKSCYNYQITSPFKNRLSIRALKHVYSKATYGLSMSESQHFTVQQVGKGANHVNIIRSLYPSRIDYVHSNMSIQGNLQAEYE